jgi:hypothetical protein
VALFGVKVCVVFFLSPVIERLAPAACISVYPHLDRQTNRPDCGFSRSQSRPQPLSSSHLLIHFLLQSLHPTTRRYHSRYTGTVVERTTKIKRSSFTSNRPAGSGFQLRHQFENVATSSRFLLDANEKLLFPNNTLTSKMVGQHLEF